MARILLVDDDDLVRQSLALRLEAAGHDVTTAVHGGDGLEAFSRVRFDVVISDIFMPEVEGMEFILALRRQCREIPIIVMTGGARRTARTSPEGVEHYLKAARQFGATYSLSKPFSPARLLELIDECVGAPGTD